MDTDAVRLTREELYQQVWAEPMVSLAKKYGLSDVGLAKICIKQRIPRPGLGYWRKKEVGLKVRQTPLPKLSTSTVAALGEIVIHRKPFVDADDAASGPVVEQRQLEEKEENKIVVPTQLTDPHPLVAKTVLALRKAKAAEGSHLAPKTTDCLAVSVTLGSADRAMCITDALIKALDARGYTTSIRQGERCKTVVRIQEEDVSFSLSEQFDSVTRELTLDEKKKYPWRQNETKSVPSGRLTLRIESYVHGLRGTWSEGKKQRLDNCLNQFIVGLVAAAAQLKQHRLEQEERQRKYWIEQEQRAAAERKKQEERHRIDALNSILKDWRKCQLVRAYLAEAKGAVEERGGAAPDSDLGRWLKWVEGYAERLDQVRPKLWIATPYEPPAYSSYSWNTPPKAGPSDEEDEL